MAAAEGHRDSPESFQHLFPPLAVTKTPEVETPPQIQRNTDATNSSGNGDLEHVDYVIVFKFPTPNQQREEEQKKVTDELKKLTSRLQRVGLRFQVKPGRTKDMLLILVSCPEETLYEEFKRERVRDFLLGIRIHGMGNEEDSDDFADEEYQHLTEAERLRTVHEILTGPENEGGASISPNVDPYVESIMPLHNKEFDEAWIKAWSKKWLISRKDLMSIRNHFGEKIAFYFAFVQNYLLWLSGPAVLGLLITVTGARSLSIWYSLAMLIWSVLFIEVWKRQEKELAIVWNVRNCSKHEKRRLEFKGDKTVPDPVTGEEMPYAPIWKIFLRRAISLPGVAVGAIALAVIVASVIAIQLFLHEYYTGPFHQILHYTPTILYVLFIPSMSNIYSNWVRLLNDWEMHKTESSWEYHYTQKIFIANFLVSYLSLFFIGWIYIPFSEHVLPYLVQLNISHEHKKVDFQRLRGQLIYFIVTGQIIGFCTEMLLPYAMKLITPKIKKFTKKDNDQNQEAATASPSESRLIEKIYKQVDRPEYNIYTDYVEMIIQFGYVSMFSTVWPLTALCCMINNWIELRGDAVKLCKYTRRPAPLRAEGVGPWIGNMETLTWLSSITMASFAYMFHPSTDLHSPYTPIFALLAVLLSEHLYVVVQFVVRSALDAIPSVSDILVRKQEFKMKKVWLNRLLVRETRDGKGRAEADTASGGVNTAAELEAKEQEEEAIRLIQNAFKTE